MALRTSRARVPGRGATPGVAQQNQQAKRPSGARTPELAIKAEALTELHCLIQRQLLLALSRQEGRNGRARDVLWCTLEALNAAFQGERLTHKDLTAVAAGVISASTLTRAVLDAEELGQLTRRAHGSDRRSHLLEPTDSARDAMLRRAERDFEAVTELMARHSRRLSALQGEVATPPAPAAGRRK